MKRKIIIPILIITLSLSITACGNKNKWDDEPSIKYGTINENIADDNESVSTEIINTEEPITEETIMEEMPETEESIIEEPNVEELASTEEAIENTETENSEDVAKWDDFDTTITEDKGYSKININNVDISGKLTMDMVENTIGLAEISYSTKIIDKPYFQFHGTGYGVKVSKDVFGFTEGSIAIDLDDNNEIRAIAVSDFSHADDMQLIWMDKIMIGSTKEEVEAIVGPAIEFETKSKIYYTYEDSIIKVVIEYEKDFDSGNYLIEEINFIYK